MKTKVLEIGKAVCRTIMVLAVFGAMVMCCSDAKDMDEKGRKYKEAREKNDY